MRSFASLTTGLVALAAFAGHVVRAQDPNFDSIDRPLKNEAVPAGKTYTITWTLIKPDTPTGPVSIFLIGGPSTNSLEPISKIGSVVNNNVGKFDWAVDPSLGAAAVYGLNISLDADPSHFQYSNPFSIVGGSSDNGTTTAIITTSITSTPPTITTTTTSSLTTSASATTSALTTSLSSKTSATVTTSTSTSSAAATTGARNSTVTTGSTPSASTVTQSGAVMLRIPAALALALAVAVWGL